MMQFIGTRYLLIFIIWGVCACGQKESGGMPSEATASLPEEALKGTTPWKADDLHPPTALEHIVEQFKQDLAVKRHASDGGGRAWLVKESGRPASVRVSSRGRWSFVYEAGPLGIRQGGGLYFQVSPFWGWSTPQVTTEERAGYTEVSTQAEGLGLEPETVDRQLLFIRISKRDMAQGEQIRLLYGAGPVGARADRYAERDSRFWFAVDGDGDGVRKLLGEAPAVDVLPEKPLRLFVFLTSTARPGDTVRLTVAVVDGLANAGCEFEGKVAMSLSEGNASHLVLPRWIVLKKEDRGQKTISLEATQPGVFRIFGKVMLGGREARAESNPLKVDSKAPRILWADLHGHSNRSDGTGVPEDYYNYARNVAGLDAAALTDHDHFGFPTIDQTPKVWDEIKTVQTQLNQPGRFVTLLGYEWTNWIHGHRHVLYFGDYNAMHSALDESSDTPKKLWKRLSDKDVITVPHHPAGGPIPINWTFASDPLIEPVVEITSAQGSSEAHDAKGLIHKAIRGHTVREALIRGATLGFVGGGDSHDGHPGLSHLSPAYGFRPGHDMDQEQLGNGGITGIFAEKLTRKAIFEAIRSRRVYATSGPRILLQVSLDGHPMGSMVPASALSKAPALKVDCVTPAEIGEVDLIRTGFVRKNIVSLNPGTSQRSLAFTHPVHPLKPGEFLYIRIIQKNGGTAWSSPIFVTN